MDEFNENDIGKLLRLKRHEQPPPGLLRKFSARVSSTSA